VYRHLVFELLHTRVIPSTVVLEINLFDMSGFQVLPQLLKDARSHAAPVIVLTHLKNPFILTVAVKKGAFSALCKSFAPPMFLMSTFSAHYLPSRRIPSLSDMRMRLLFFLLL
jgi:DNA-binding response OmpR family regulator